ncbi:MAG: CbiX/SirB N-terminal domain-containing protein [Bryobacteraceae bacterium]
MMNSAFIIFAHGSSVESANEAVRIVARQMAAAGGYANVEAAFLEGGKPDLAGAVDAVAARGASRVIVVPYFLTLGLHLKRDLPKLVDEARASHPNLQIDVTPPLDGHPAMVEALLGRAREAEVQ